MWMMNGGNNNEPNRNDFFNPNPNTTTTLCTNNTTLTPPTYAGLKHHLAKISFEQSSHGRDQLEEQAQVMGSSRWNPTAEQLLALEEKYRCGTRTPTTDQIQQIASELRRFGKIEGKNVFYWFQNHKARERQKLRRRRQVQEKHNNNVDHDESLNKQKESVHGLDQANNLVPHSNCSTEHVEGPVTVHGAAILAESRGLDMHAIWQTIDLPSSTPVLHHFTSTMTSRFTTKSKFLSLGEHGWLLRPTKTETHANHDDDDDEIRDFQTLQLFPLCSDGCSGANGTQKEDRKVPIRTINTNSSSSQFFEFLPLKN